MRSPWIPDWRERLKKDLAEFRDFLQRLFVAAMIVLLLGFAVTEWHLAHAAGDADNAAAADQHDGGFGTSLATPPKTATAPHGGVQSELDGVLNSMQGLLTDGDRLVANLRLNLGNSPQATKELVDNAAKVLSGVADKASPTGDLAKALTDIRNTALAHKQAVSEMPTGSMTEEGRGRVLDAWSRVIDTTTKAQAGLSDIHDQYLSVLSELRMRQAEVGELMLADQYQAALQTVTQWVENLKATLKQLHGVMTGGAGS